MKFDPLKPLGNPIIRHIIQRQWFSTGRAEGVRAVSSAEFRDIPLPILALVLSAVSHPIFIQTHMETV
jgi:hypothetical protein